MGFFGSLLLVLLILTAIFLIVLVLIQRGKGGGLAGAFGGMGGQSAFGTKAGDLFTKVTIVTAAAWIILCLVTIKVLGIGGGVLSDQMGSKAESRQSTSVPAGAERQPAGGPGATDQQPAGDQGPPPVTPVVPGMPGNSPAQGGTTP
jgi:preprotein translocase subunit SecG